MQLIQDSSYGYSKSLEDDSTLKYQVDMHNAKETEDGNGSFAAEEEKCDLPIDYKGMEGIENEQNLN